MHKLPDKLREILVRQWDPLGVEHTSANEFIVDPNPERGALKPLRISDAQCTTPGNTSCIV